MIIGKMDKDPWMVKIVKYLGKTGMAHTAQVARGVHIATTTAHKYLNRLMEEGIVVMNKTGVGKPVFWTLEKTKMDRPIKWTLKKMRFKFDKVKK